MSNVDKANNSLMRPTFYQDWTKLPAPKKFDIDFIIPTEAKSLSDVAKMTGLKLDFLEKIVKVEKLKNKVYLDSEGHLTIGIGHNIDADKNYNLGDSISDEQAYNLFAKDLKVRLAEQKTLTGGAKLNTGQKQALLDVAFNVGYGNMQDTKLIKKIKTGKVNEAVSELDCVFAGGKVNTGLCKRRMENVYDYSKEKPTPVALNTLQVIKRKGESAFNKKIKIACQSLKKGIKIDKEAYLKECNKIIQKISTRLHKKNTKKL